MIFDSVKALTAEGFIGFKDIEYLFSSCSDVPFERGNYVVLYLKRNLPVFVKPGVGGFFKGENPNQPTAELFPDRHHPWCAAMRQNHSG